MENDKSLFEKIFCINRNLTFCDKSLRDALKIFMEQWASNTIKDNSIDGPTLMHEHSSTIMYEDTTASLHRVFFLFPGESELIAIVNKESIFVGKDEMWWDILTIGQLRTIIDKLPSAIGEILDQMDRNMKANEESLSILSTLTTSEDFSKLAKETT